MERDLREIYGAVAELVGADRDATLSGMFAILSTDCEYVNFTEFNMGPPTSTLQMAFERIGVMPDQIIMLDPFDGSLTAIGSLEEIQQRFDMTWGSEEQVLLLDSKGKWVVGVNESGGVVYALAGKEC